MLSLFRKSEKDMEYNGYLFWGLVAIEFFMSFSFLGYIHIEPISLTVVYIPVLVAGCILGPRESMLVGTVFGLASMWKASAFYVGAGDSIFSPVMSGKPVESFLLSVGSRALFGLVIGFLYRAAKRSRHPLLGILIITSAGRRAHSFFVYLFMQLLLPETGFTVRDAMEDFGRLDYVLFLLIADVIVVLCYTARKSDYVKNFFLRVKRVDQVNALTPRYKCQVGVMIVLLILASLNVAIYFTNRLRRMMITYGLELGQEMSYDLMHLQMQFLFGMVALASFVIIIIILYQKNYNYLYYEAKTDGLTGLLGRQQFFQLSRDILESTSYNSKERRGWFIILDIDKFKQINDVHGHPAGDSALKQVAGNLKAVFGNEGIIGRLGGDEFVVLVSRLMSRDEIENSSRNLKNGMRGIMIGGEKITCSIGGIPVEEGYTIEELYKHADRLLYEAKKNGKDQFVFGQLRNINKKETISDQEEEK